LVLPLLESSQPCHTDVEKKEEEKKKGQRAARSLWQPES
jgi:hypothetical protein